MRVMKTMPGTERGRKVRQKIIAAAAGLIHKNGVAGTSVDQVLAASKTGKSQFYYYFDSKDHLVREVLRYHVDRTIEDRAEAFQHLDTWEGIEEWFKATAESDCMNGCPIGCLAAEMAERDEALRRDLSSTFASVQSYWARGLASLKARGDLRDDADPDALAEYVVAAMQGGMLLSRTRRDTAPMRNVLRQTLNYLHMYREN